VSVVALLDVSVLVALFDADHVHHEIAHDWFADQRTSGWATCPMTENGLIRVFSNPAITLGVYPPGEVAQRLATFRASGHHHFWADSLSLTDQRIFNPAFLRGHKQVTDIYLLGLAKAAGGALATFDRSIPLGAVKGAPKSALLVIEPADRSG
jgi:hypothetical protein